MIEQIKDKSKIKEICDKIKYVKDCPIDEQSFYYHLYAGMINGKILLFGSYENEKMNGCLVLELSKDLSTDLILSLVFVWIDKDKPKLWIDFIKYTEEKAKEFKADKILINTKRSARAIEKKLNKYGYNAKYTIFEKKVS
ncbi:MAG: hypothetical protein U9O59_02130 [Actinomycetota bacterium]|nr:hypothetical protein [Actinomycetota bacterium]